MKKIYFLFILVTVLFFCCSCSKDTTSQNGSNSDDKYTDTYVMPIEIYAYMDLDELNDEEKTYLFQQVTLTLQAAESDNSLTKGLYDDVSQTVSLTFNVNQKKSYVSKLKNYLNFDSATMFSNGEYRLEHYSDDSKYMRVSVLDKTTFSKCKSSFKMAASNLIQLQILFGTSYEDTSVTAEIIYSDGTIEEQVLTWKDIY